MGRALLPFIMATPLRRFASIGLNERVQISHPCPLNGQAISDRSPEVAY